MNIEYFNEYLKYEQLGIKSKEKEYLNNFIKSFENYNEKVLWTMEYLPKLKFNHHNRIRNELFEEIVFPVLLEGYNNRNIKSMIWIVKLNQNFTQNEKLWKKINYVSNLSLIMECYKMEPDNSEIIDLYLEIIIEKILYRIHEWPDGILIGNRLAEKDECKKLLEEIPLLNKLDRNNEYNELIMEYENILNEYINR
ncbi:MAG: hypothetical protein LBP88_06635 [Treponema sp.]|jgi:hypothetical protein|nr:hypothetical protein [Treponema sp.]